LKDNSDFDVEYYAFGMLNGRIHFRLAIKFKVLTTEIISNQIYRGIRASHIFYDNTDKTWTLESFKTPGRISKLSESQSIYGYPFGRLTWTIKVSKIQFCSTLVIFTT